MREITEKKREEAELKRLNEDLTQFTFAATHDLREPLRMITAYAQMLERKLGATLDKNSAGFLAHIVGGTQRITRLVDGLLQFSRIGQIDAAIPKLWIPPLP